MEKTMAAIVKKIKFDLLVSKAVEAKPRYFRFDVNALADFEQEVGMGFPQLMASRAVFAATRALLWAGLKHEDRRLTIPGVGILMQKYLSAGGSIDELLGVAMKAAAEQEALGKNEVEPDPDPETEDEDKDEEAQEDEQRDPPSPPATKEPDSSGTIG